jgi:hypothetical protein
MGGFSMEDYYTYADWSGLRPLTELEYEKMCRGTDRTGVAPGIAVYPVNGEYAWGESAGLSSFSTTASLTNDGTVSEGIVSPTSSILNIALISTGPVRCGIFAAKNPTSNQRRLTGASYYGVMELTGNLEEFVLPASIQYQQGSCNSTPYTYAGSHGDGNIDQSIGRVNNPGFGANNDIANYPFWLFRRGGSYSSVEVVSSRSASTYLGASTWCSGVSWTSRVAQCGFRGGLSASTL